MNTATPTLAGWPCPRCMTRLTPAGCPKCSRDDADRERLLAQVVALLDTPAVRQLADDCRHLGHHGHAADLLACVKADLLARRSRNGHCLRCGEPTKCVLLSTCLKCIELEG